MNAAERRFACVVLAAISTPATAADKADICHWNANWAQVISVSTSAVASHFAQHGDSYVAQYYRDSDGDGFGDAKGAVLPCPNDGYVANNSDCNDGDSSVSPHASEVSCDGIDNDCNPDTIEGDCCTVDTCAAGDTSGNRAEIEASWTECTAGSCSESPCASLYLIPGDPDWHWASLSSPATASGDFMWSQVIYRTVLAPENPASYSADTYDLGFEMEWVNAEGTHASVVGGACWAGYSFSWAELAVIGKGPGDPVEFCVADQLYYGLDGLPSGTWTLKASVIDYEKNETFKTCSAGITTVP